MVRRLRPVLDMVVAKAHANTVMAASVRRVAMITPIDKPGARQQETTVLVTGGQDNSQDG